jgi:nicotinamidase-related amidase
MSVATLTLDPATSALVLIDLQASNVERDLQPHAAAQVVANARRLADAVRAHGGLVVYARVLVNALLSLPADAPLRRPADAPPLPHEACEIVAAVGMQSGDLLISKRQWGAFYGTELDLLLRRRGIRTVVLAGIATNFGVESTARTAFDYGYELVFVEDAMSSVSAPMHEFAVAHVFKRMGRVRSTAQVLDALPS